MAVNRHNIRYLKDLPVANVEHGVCISPKSKASLKQMVLGVVGSDSQKCPIVFVGAGERVNAVVYQDLPLFLRRLEAVVAKNGGYIE